MLCCVIWLITVLLLLENWFNIGVTCVKWGTVYSAFFALTCGIRQGGVLSPYLFAVFIDGVVQRVQASGIGCYVKFICFNIILYADDILLLAPSVTALQQLLHICETELACLDMVINVGKSACMRIGSRYNTISLSLSSACYILNVTMFRTQWVTEGGGSCTNSECYKISCVWHLTTQPLPT